MKTQPARTPADTPAPPQPNFGMYMYEPPALSPMLKRPPPRSSQARRTLSESSVWLAPAPSASPAGFAERSQSEAPDLSGGGSAATGGGRISIAGRLRTAATFVGGGGMSEPEGALRSLPAVDEAERAAPTFVASAAPPATPAPAAANGGKVPDVGRSVESFTSPVFRPIDGHWTATAAAAVAVTAPSAVGCAAPSSRSPAASGVGEVKAGGGPGGTVGATGTAMPAGGSPAVAASTATAVAGAPFTAAESTVAAAGSSGAALAATDVGATAAGAGATTRAAAAAPALERSPGACSISAHATSRVVPTSVRMTTRSPGTNSTTVPRRYPPFFRRTVSTSSARAAVPASSTEINTKRCTVTPRERRRPRSRSTPMVWCGLPCWWDSRHLELMGRKRRHLA